MSARAREHACWSVGVAWTSNFWYNIALVWHRVERSVLQGLRVCTSLPARGFVERLEMNGACSTLTHGLRLVLNQCTPTHATNLRGHGVALAPTCR